MGSAKSRIKRQWLLSVPAGAECGQSLAQHSLVFALLVLASVMAVIAIGLVTNTYFVEFFDALS